MPITKLSPLAVCCSGIVLISALTGCQKAPATNAAAPQDIPEVKVMEAKPTEVVLTAENPGRLEAYRQAEIRARVSGIVLTRAYEEGQEVKEGTLLFQIDPAPLKATFDAAAARHEEAVAHHASAYDKLERYQSLATSNAISDRDLREASAEEKRASATIASTRAEMETARLRLEYASVTSPINGRARKAAVTEGALVGEGTATLLTTVEQLDPIYVNFSQPSAEVLALRKSVSEGALKGMEDSQVKVEITLSDGSTYKHAGKLLFSDLAVEPGTDGIAMRALFPNPDRELLPGMFVHVKVDRAIDQRAFLVPKVALVRAADRAQLVTVNDDGSVAHVDVEANSMQNGQWRVTSGLKGGEKIILENPGFMMPGIKVKPVLAP